MAEEIEKCVLCKFFLLDKKDPSQGRCRRYPPSGFRGIDYNGPGEVYSYGGDEFPLMRTEEWCGEFQIGQEREKGEG